MHTRSCPALLSIATAASLMTLAGCASSHTGKAGSPEVVRKASSQQEAAMLDRIKSLAGEWEAPDEKGQSRVATIYTVTSAGSAVREVMLPGTGHEMTNMYTMNGGDLVMTHYCAMGNQPHLVAHSAGPDRITMKMDSVGNFTAPDDMYMGELTIVFVDDNHIRQEWRSYQSGKLSEHEANFDLTRRVSR